MEIYYLLVILSSHLYLSDAAVYPECVPACGEAFLLTKEEPRYYEDKVEETYEANKGKSSKVIYQAIKGKIMPDQRELGKNAGYFEHCTSVKGDLNTKRGLEVSVLIALIMAFSHTL
nr:unnamed protein product [Callosobruchus chinensis]